jgi:hypothetical protein
MTILRSLRIVSNCTQVCRSVVNILSHLGWQVASTLFCQTYLNTICLQCQQKRLLLLAFTVVHGSVFCCLYELLIRCWWIPFLRWSLKWRYVDGTIDVEEKLFVSSQADQSSLMLDLQVLGCIFECWLFGERRTSHAIIRSYMFLHSIELSRLKLTTIYSDGSSTSVRLCQIYQQHLKVM